MMTEQRSIWGALRPHWAVVLVLGLGAGWLVSSLQDQAGRATNDESFWMRTGLLREAAADLGEEGEFVFLPNRRSVWVVNRLNGRMATYIFRDDGPKSLDRSRIATLDLKTFPMEDTSLLLSDRNLQNVLWVCNRRTGDLQMWRPTREGVLKSSDTVITSRDLMTRATKADPQ